jgi:hypothetical protein
LTKLFLATGTARDDLAEFEFKIVPQPDSGFLLLVHFDADGRGSISGGGKWPTIERAKQAAEESASKVLEDGVKVEWREN